MYKISSFIAGLLLLMFSAPIFAASLNMYEKPDEESKIVSSIASGKQLIPIFYTDKKDWVKVANPQNGDVGWVKTSELKGPVVLTKINGSKIQQQIIVDKGGKKDEPIIYNVVQYSGPKELKQEEAEKMIKDMEQQNKKMREHMQQMQNHMRNSMHRMFQEFDKELYTTFPVMHPIIVVPDNSIKQDQQEKNKK